MNIITPDNVSPTKQTNVFKYKCPECGCITQLFCQKSEGIPELYGIDNGESPDYEFKCQNSNCSYEFKNDDLKTETKDKK